MAKKLTEAQRIRNHDKEHTEYQLKTQGFTGQVYPIKKDRSESSPKSEDRRALSSFKDLVKRAREKNALVELILPEGESI